MNGNYVSDYELLGGTAKRNIADIVTNFFVRHLFRNINPDRLDMAILLVKADSATRSSRRGTALDAMLLDQVKETLKGRERFRVHCGILDRSSLDLKSVWPTPSGRAKALLLECHVVTAWCWRLFCKLFPGGVETLADSAPVVLAFRSE